MEILWFLVKGPAQNEVFGSWYMDGGYTLGLVVSVIVAFVAVMLFYYLWAKLKPVTVLHWLVTMVVSSFATFGIVFFAAKSRLTNYISVNMLDQADPTAIQRVAAGTLDMWMFSLNSLIYTIVFFFLLSLILKRWSNGYPIPFGVKRKK